MVGWAVLRGNFVSAAVQLSAKPPLHQAKVCSCGAGASGADRHPLPLPFPKRGICGEQACLLLCSAPRLRSPFLGKGQASRPWSHSQLRPPTQHASHCLRSCSFPGLQECGRAVTRLPLPSLGPNLGIPASGPSWPEGVFPLRLTLGTTTGSRAEAGHSATSLSPRAPQNSPPAPAPGLGTLTATACPVSC